MHKIKEGDFSLDGEPWKGVSEDAKELVKGMKSALGKWATLSLSGWNVDFKFIFRRCGSFFFFFVITVDTLSGGHTFEILINKNVSFIEINSSICSRVLCVFNSSNSHILPQLERKKEKITWWPQPFKSLMIEGLLTVDPERRLKLSDLKENSWLQGGASMSTTPLCTPDVLESSGPTVRTFVNATYKVTSCTVWQMSPKNNNHNKKWVSPHTFCYFPVARLSTVVRERASF